MSRAILKRYLARSRRPERRPLALERAPRRLHGEVDVPRPGECDLGQVLLGRGRDGREPLARAWRHLLAADEEPVALLERDDLARLRRGGVLPLERRGQGAGGGRLRGHQSIVK